MKQNIPLHIQEYLNGMISRNFLINPEFDYSQKTDSYDFLVQRLDSKYILSFTFDKNLVLGYCVIEDELGFSIPNQPFFQDTIGDTSKCSKLKGIAAVLQFNGYKVEEKNITIKF